MRISGRGLAAICASLALANVALGQVPGQSGETPSAAEPSTPTPEIPAPAAKAPVLPKMEVVAPKSAPKKAPRPPAKTLPVATPPPAAPAPAQAASPSPGPSPGPVAATPAPPAAVEVRMSPIAGSELPIDKVPAGVSVVPSALIERAATASITEAINTYVPGATINEALGNALATDLQYRGFTASPLNGTPQGLAIYQNGVRMNEVFGDTMNWDLIPQIAIADIVIMSNNRAFGLNALGGSVNVIMKDGFSFQGATVDSRIGSFGHKEVAAEAGQKWGNWATYVAGEWIDENGWRDLSPASAKRAYWDLGVKGSSTEVHLNYTFADTFLGVVGPTPVQLLDERRANVFTSPQSFDNRMHMVNLTGSVSVTDTLKVSGNT